MALNSFRNYRIASYAAGVGIIFSAAAALVMGNPEQLLAHSFARALNGAPAAQNVEWAALRDTGFRQAVHLPASSADGRRYLRTFNDGPTVLPNPVMVGDRITFTSEDGTLMLLEVTQISVLDNDIIRVNRSLAQARLLLVVARVLNDGNERLVRFFIGTGAAPVTPSAPSPDQT